MKEKTKIIIFIALIVFGLWTWSNHNTINSLRRELFEYQDALSEANDNIEQANSYIEEAQAYAWNSYEDMGWALDNLETVDMVNEPHSSGFLPTFPKLPKLPKLPSLR